jgi:hypothetical protein
MGKNKMIKLIDILKEIIEGTCGYTTDVNTNKKLNTPGGLKEFEGDSNPLKLSHIDTWHDGQNKAQENKTEEAIKLMVKAADEAEKYAKENQDGGVAGEAGYYRGTIAWLKKDYTTVEKYINDKFVKFTGNDEVLKKLLRNKDKSYKEAYEEKTKRSRLQKETSDSQSGKAAPYGSGFAPVKELVTDTEIICNNCGWKWKIVDGGDDLYICHKCNHDNTPEQLNEKCWPGYTKKGMKTMFGKKYPNCVKK